jgi:hypothetical protein
MALYQSLPSQKNTQLEKRDKAWQKQCLDSIIGISFNTANIYQKNQTDKQLNYNLIAGDIDYSEMTWLTDPYLINEEFGGQPAKLVCIPLIQTKVNQLLGDELKRKFKYKAICTGGKGINKKNEKKVEYLQNYYKNKVYKELGINPEQLPEGFQEPKQIVEFFDYKYDELSEVYANRILTQAEKDLNLKYVFNQGFKDVLAVSEEIYRVTKKNDKPFVRTVDTRFFFCYKSNETPYIEDGFIYKEERRLTPAAIIDEYSEYLTEEELDKVNAFLTNNSYIGAVNNDFLNLNSYSSIKLVRETSNTFQVHEVAWASQQKIGYLTYYDEFDNKRCLVITDENFKLSKKQKEDKRNVLRWQWVTQWWQGTRIGSYTSNIDINIKPCEVQMCPYIGARYNALHTKPTSLVDYLKPYQFLYDQIFYRFQCEVAKGKGKKFVMDVSLLPKDMAMEKWTYEFETGSIIWVNSAQEGNELVRDKNLLSQIDLSLSNNIQAYVQIMTKLEQLMDKTSGITPNREGTPTPYASGTMYENAVANSYNITEPIFFLHDIVKRNVLTYLVEFSKECYKNIEVDVAFLNSDLLREAVAFDIDLLHGSSYGVFIQDSQQDEEIINFIKQNAQAAISNNIATLGEVVEVLKTGSPSEAVHILNNAFERRNKQEQANQQQTMQLEQQKQQAALNESVAQKNFELAKQKNDLDNKMRIAELQSNTQLNIANGTPSYSEISSIEHKNEDLAHKQNIEQQKVLNEVVKNQSNLAIEQEKLNLKREEIKADMYVATVNRNKYSPDIPNKKKLSYNKSSESNKKKK